VVYNANTLHNFLTGLHIQQESIGWVEHRLVIEILQLKTIATKHSALELSCYTTPEDQNALPVVNHQPQNQVLLLFVCIT